MSTKKILVIEDNQKHLADARAFFADKPEYQVEYAEDGISGVRAIVGDKDFNASIERLKSQGLCSSGYAGVITDIFMPWDPSEGFLLEAPTGFSIAKLCSELGIPAVMNTSGNHHGKNFQWMHAMIPIMGLGQVPLIDSADVNRLVSTEERNAVFEARSAGQDAEYSIKNWTLALEMLEVQMNKPKS